MGLYQYIRELWKQPRKNLGGLWYSRLIEWRKEPATVRIKKPTRIDKARALGYKAKPGFIIVRQRVEKGGHRRAKPRAGRRSKRMSLRKTLGMNYQWIAEQRVERKYKNCAVLNSYYVGEDGQYYWYEVILVDREHPVIKSDSKINWICTKKGRAARGLTSAARKSRGLRNKGKGAEKIRPSLRAHRHKGK